MWAKNLLLAALCLVGVLAVAAGLLRSERLETPRSFDPQRSERPEFREVVQQVNADFQQQWQSQQLQNAPPADYLTVARRLSLALCGTVPSLEEIRALQRQPEDVRLEWWLSHLLEDRRSSDYMAERLARAYVGTENGPFLVYRRRRFVFWLSDRLQENQRYDQLVRKLVGSQGLWTDSPAVNFLTVTMTDEEDRRPDPIRLAGRTARAFLGMRIDCLQCHDDRLGNIELGTPDEPRGGQQQDFHRLAAFYAPAESSLLGVRDGDNKYEYQYLHADKPQAVDPEPPFFPELRGSGESLREELANWITHPDNKPFARATVNRFWALLFGRPLVEPIDDLPLHGPFPAALETLAEDFVAHGYDLKRLIRIIAATDVFRADSRADFEITPEHERAWAVFPLTRLRPEQVAGGLIQACSLRTIDANAHIFARLARFGQQNDFLQRYGDTGEDEFEDRGGTVSQRLLLMNGELVKERTQENMVANAPTRVAALAGSNEQAVETAYLCVLSRPPSDDERQHFAARLEGQQGSGRNQAMEDMYWVLINSTEFSWNH
ncbi:MAG: DUF1553 domain-containing protein [Pirellulaceae bacterium]|nr:DUF1553 domain-containing protein [Pirellulaceae bacterium]